MTLEWVDPPKKARRTDRILCDATLAELRALPGEWARLRTYPNPGPASTTKLHLLKDGLCPDDIELLATTVDQQGSALFARAILP